MLWHTLHELDNIGNLTFRYLVLLKLTRYFLIHLDLFHFTKCLKSQTIFTFYFNYQFSMIADTTICNPTYCTHQLIIHFGICFMKNVKIQIFDSDFCVSLEKFLASSSLSKQNQHLCAAIITVFNSDANVRHWNDTGYDVRIRQSSSFLLGKEYGHMVL